MNDGLLGPKLALGYSTPMLLRGMTVGARHYFHATIPNSFILE